MVAAYQSVAHQSANLSGDPVVTKPSGTAQGDLLIAIGVASGSATITAPAGWTQHASSLSNVTPIWTKVAGASEPANYTFVVSGATANSLVVIARINAADASSPIDLVTGVTGTGALVIPTQTVTGANRRLLYMSGKLGNCTWTESAGTERWDSNANSQVMGTAGADEVVNAGATGTRTMTPSGGSALGVAYMISIKPEPPNNGDVSGSVSTSGSFAGSRDSEGSVSGSVSTSGSFAGSRDSEGSVNGVVATSGSFTGSRDSTGEVSGVVASSGTFAGSRESSGDFSGNVAVSGNFAGSRNPKGSFSDQRVTGGAFHGLNGDSNRFNGSVDTEGSFSGSRESAGSFAGSVATSGEFDGSRESAGSFAGSVATSGAFDGSVEHQGSFAGSVATSGEFSGENGQSNSFSGSVTTSGVVRGRNRPPRHHGATIVEHGRTHKIAEHVRSVQIQEIP